MRKPGRIATVAVAAGALFALNQGSALAIEAGCWTNDGDPGGKSCRIYHQGPGNIRVDMVRFMSYGEQLTLSDYAANGEGVMAIVNGEKYYWSGGAGTGTTFNLSFAEGTRVTLTSCQTRSDRDPYDCHTEQAVA
ncbi:hypothetical protein ACIBCM_09545 [Streptomyces sp. NPDC051018]|uniref:hypothetical protein n=1 Tax=Streptomyces sp. NPDC051018 TaxID=3365639 RepID=UPI0037961615